MKDIDRKKCLGNIESSEILDFLESVPFHYVESIHNILTFPVLNKKNIHKKLKEIGYKYREWLYDHCCYDIYMKRIKTLANIFHFDERICIIDIKAEMHEIIPDYVSHESLWITFYAITETNGSYKYINKILDVEQDARQLFYKFNDKKYKEVLDQFIHISVMPKGPTNK